MIRNANATTLGLMNACLSLSMAASQSMYNLLEKVNNAADVLGAPDVGPTVTTEGADLLKVNMQYDFKRVRNARLVLAISVRANSCGTGYQIVTNKTLSGSGVTERLRNKVMEAESLEDLADVLNSATKATSTSW